jgi:hypothetical protein
MSVAGPNNSDMLLLPAADRTATTATAMQQNFDSSGIVAVLTTTAVGGGENFTPVFETYDYASNQWVQIVASFTAISGAGTIVLAIHPAALTQAPATAQKKIMVVPRYWRFSFTHSGSATHNYSLTVNCVP